MMISTTHASNNCSLNPIKLLSKPRVPGVRVVQGIIKRSSTEQADCKDSGGTTIIPIHRDTDLSKVTSGPLKLHRIIQAKRLYIKEKAQYDHACRILSQLIDSMKGYHTSFKMEQIVSDDDAQADPAKKHCVKLTWMHGEEPVRVRAVIDLAEKVCADKSYADRWALSSYDLPYKVGG